MEKIHKKKLIKKTKMEINKSIFLKINLGVKKIYSWFIFYFHTWYRIILSLNNPFCLIGN